MQRGGRQEVFRNYNKSRRTNTMPLSVNTNTAAASASYFLSKNNAALQKSLNRLSSGSRITKPSDDAGGLAVSMKLQGTINRLERS